MSYANVEIRIIQWAEKKDKEAVVDAVGDVMVCLINYCALQDINLVDCMEVAYDQIKNRKGTLLPSGLFVKDAT
jgi:NTP pyrophosphatase (non-canonical NTP hydrolase)